MMKLTVACVSNESLDSKQTGAYSFHHQEACHMHKMYSLAQILRMFLTSPQFRNNQFMTLKNLSIANIHRKICHSSSFLVTISPHFKIQIFNRNLSGYSDTESVWYILKDSLRGYCLKILHLLGMPEKSRCSLPAYTLCFMLF